MKPLLPLAVLILACPLSAREKAPSPPEADKFVLEPFQVHGTATSNFAIDIQIFVSRKSGKVASILITRVAEDSDAAERGVQAGDQIVKLNGVPVERLDPWIDRNSQIGRIFLNRTPGDRLNLELLGRRTQHVTLPLRQLPEKIYVWAATQATVSLFVKRVADRPAGTHPDLLAGDEIVKINGVPVRGLDPKADLNGQIERIVLDHTSDQTLQLELVGARTQKVTLRALRPLEIRPAGNKWD